MGRSHARALGRLGAAGAVASLLALGAAARPAEADAPGATFTVTQSATELLAPADQEDTGSRTGSVGAAFQDASLSFAADDGRSTLTGVRVVVDGRRLLGVAELRLPAGCGFTDSKHLQALCALGDVAGGGHLLLGLRAAAAAEPGAAGELRYTVTATNAVEHAGARPDVTAVSVADGPDLSVEQLPTITRTTSAGDTAVEAAVTNQGDQDAHGVVLFFTLPPGYALAGDFANCVYPARPSTRVLCRFDDTVVHPGQVLRPSVPITLRAGGSPANGRFEYGVDLTGGPLDQEISGGPGVARHGSGAPLTLVPATARPAADFGSALSSSWLMTGQVVDLAAVASDFGGSVGDTVQAVFAVRNAGDLPAPTLPGDGSGGGYGLTVAFPSGVRIATAPAGCAPVAGSTDPTYLCRESRVLAAGESETFAFQVQLTAVLDHAPGRASLTGADTDAGAANNSAAFAVTAVATTASATPSAPASAAPGGHSTSASPSAGGPDSPSASTEPTRSTSAGTVATVGGAIVVGPAVVTRQTPAGSGANADGASAGPVDPDGSNALAQTGGGDNSLPLAVAGGVAIALGVGMVAVGTHRQLGRRR
ncbi:hypothetical protein GCM10009665_65620 [Kitasatospora nipponensis]|uniref:Repeat protein (TIGR01451 family) n=1 Tax=Kitasatospora nipponensis TaxID=258049 RepID=A0ABN1WXH4_9ACTN